MLLKSLFAALAAGIAVEVLASPLSHEESMHKREVPATHALHERHASHVKNHWSKRSRAAPGTLIPMRIGLKQSNIEAGHNRLAEISNPASVHYGKQMTAEEVVDFFKPDKTRISTVIDWLVSSGISNDRIGLSANKQWVQFDAPVEEAEELLFTDFYVWEANASGAKDISCEEYHVPAHVQSHIDYITPGIRLRHDGNSDKAKRNSPTHVQSRDDSKTPVARGEKRDDLKAPEQDGRDKHGLKKGNPHHGVRPPKVNHFERPGLPGVNSTSCDTYITAECVRAQYGIPKGRKAAAGNKLGIFESLGDHYSTADLELFLSTLYSGVIPRDTEPEDRLIDGAIGSVEDVDKFFKVTGYPPGSESNLDFQVSIPLIWPQETVLFETDDWYYEEAGVTPAFLDAIDGSYCTYSAFNETGDCTAEDCLDPSYPDTNWNLGYKGNLQCGVYKPTNVISISYGTIEDLLPNNYLYRQCSEYMKLGLQGVTVIAASGDYGVASQLGCINGTIFVPTFPSTCPYVLSVGSTELDNPKPNSTVTRPYEKLEEIATTRFYSGGGFSNIFSVPDYQRDAVQGYYDQVESSLPFTGYNETIVDGVFPSDILPNQLFHQGGRGFPDVSAVGDRQLIVYEQEWGTIGGTSMSTPIWASVLTLINEERIAAGKKTLGFVQPILYANKHAFNDITVGTNAECETTSGLPAGFTAAKGWDPVTGLGSPNFPILSKVLLEAP